MCFQKTGFSNQDVVHQSDTYRMYLSLCVDNYTGERHRRKTSLTEKQAYYFENEKLDCYSVIVNPNSLRVKY